MSALWDGLGGMAAAGQQVATAWMNDNMQFNRYVDEMNTKIQLAQEAENKERQARVDRNEASYQGLLSSVQDERTNADFESRLKKDFAAEDLADPEKKQEIIDSLKESGAYDSYMKQYKPSTKEELEMRLKAAISNGDDKHAQMINGALQNFNRTETANDKLAQAVLLQQLKNNPKLDQNDAYRDRTDKYADAKNRQTDARWGGGGSGYGAPGQPEDRTPEYLEKRGDKLRKEWSLGLTAKNQMGEKETNDVVVDKLGLVWEKVAGVRGGREAERIVRNFISAEGGMSKLRAMDGDQFDAQFNSYLNSLTSKPAAVNPSMPEAREKPAQQAGGSRASSVEKPASAMGIQSEDILDRLGMIDGYRARSLLRAIQSGNPTTKMLEEYSALVQRALDSNSKSQRINLY